MSNAAFNMVNDPNFTGWQKMDNISEDELFKDAGSPKTGQSFGNEQPVTEEPQSVDFNGQQPPLMQQAGTNIGKFFSAELAVEIVDTLATSGGTIAAHFLDIKVPRSTLSATQREKEMLKEPMQNVLDSMQVRITNPYEALFYAILAVYGSKLAVAYITAPAKEKTEKQAESGQEKTIQRRHTGKPDCKCSKCLR